MASDWDATWQRVVAFQGETFRQKRGKPFTYRVHGGSVWPSTTNRMLPRSQFEQAYELMPLDGPGRIQHLQGPSYIWAILNDSRVGGGDAAPEAQPTVRELAAVPGTPSTELPGTPVTREDLLELGFRPLELDVLSEIELLRGERGVNWTTLGEVPDSPGIYAFTVTDGSRLHVAYVGMTSHLWMVTKGRLPRGGGRGGQRYGRPKHAGVTRQRINVEVAKQVTAGRTVQHWLMPMTDSSELAVTEAGLIERWDLRRSGWNRG